MKKSVLLLIIFISAQVCFSQVSKYDFRKKVQAVDSAGWYSVVLTSDVFKNTNRNFSDLRIYQFNSTDTVEFPYLLKINQQEITEEIFRPKVLNQTTKNKNQYFTFELPKNEEVNFINLLFNETNFDGTVTLEGSNDQKEWFEIKKNERIISITNENINFYSATIHFTPQAFLFFRSTVKVDKTLTLKEATLKKEIVKPAIQNEVELAWSSKVDKKEKETIVEIALKDFRPVANLRITINEKIDYYRPFRFEKLSDSTKTPKGWQYFYETILEGYLTSLDSNQFVFDYSSAKKFRVVIDDYDNAPLKIKSVNVFSPQVELIARMNAGDSYLYFGNKNAALPNYDVINFKNKIPVSVSALQLSSLENLTTEASVESPFIQNKIWLWVFMGIVIAVLGFFTLRMMKEK